MRQNLRKWIRGGLNPINNCKDCSVNFCPCCRIYFRDEKKDLKLSYPTFASRNASFLEVHFRLIFSFFFSIILVQCLKGLHPNSISVQIFLIINKQHIIVFAEKGRLLQWEKWLQFGEGWGLDLVHLCFLLALFAIGTLALVLLSAK